MRNKPCISIIVPVYNVEKYLKKCITSILKQTFRDFELILVDDGSTDCSGKICDDFAKMDSRIFVIHKNNAGLSSARNIGISIARGNYLGFVDSDDYIATDMYEMLYKNLIREDADISVCGIYHCYAGRKSKVNEFYYKVLNVQEAIRFIFERKDADVSAWNKLYKKEIFHSVRYPEGKIYEDTYVIVRLFMLCRKIVFSSERKYYYCHRAGSITTKHFTKRNFALIEAYRENFLIIKKYFPEIKKIAAEKLYYANFIVLDGMIASGCEKEYREEISKVVKFLKRHYKEMLYCNTFTIKRKISMLILKISFPAYKILSHYYAFKYMRVERTR